MRRTVPGLLTFLVILLVCSGCQPQPSTNVAAKGDFLNKNYAWGDNKGTRLHYGNGPNPFLQTDFTSDDLRAGRQYYYSNKVFRKPSSEGETELHFGTGKGGFMKKAPPPAPKPSAPSKALGDLIEFVDRVLEATE